MCNRTNVAKWHIVSTYVETYKINCERIHIMNPNSETSDEEVQSTTKNTQDTTGQKPDAEIRKLIDIIEKMQAENTKLKSSIGDMRIDVDRLRAVISDKPSKAIITELEGKIGIHTKALDVVSKKMYEMQANVTAFVQQPVSNTLLETLRKQLMDEIMANTRSLIEFQIEKTNRTFEDKIIETRGMINNAKRFMYH